MVAPQFGEHEIVGLLVPAFRASQERLQGDDHPLFPIFPRQFPTVEKPLALAPDATRADRIPVGNVLKADAVLSGIHVDPDARQRQGIERVIGSVVVARGEIDAATVPHRSSDALVFRPPPASVACRHRLRGDIELVTEKIRVGQQFADRDEMTQSYRERSSTFVFEPSQEGFGSVTGPDGCSYDSPAEAMYFSLGCSCGCGHPEEVHQLIIECLGAFDRDKVGWELKGTGLDRISAIISARPYLAAELLAHALTGECLLEHGGGVGGSWLTDRGKQFIAVGPYHGGQ